MNYSNENEFLKNYDPEQYSPVAVTVDCVVFGITKVSSENYRKLDKQSLNVLLVKRKDYPCKGQYALPGGFVGQDETLEEAAVKVLKHKTGLDDIFLEQLYTFGDVNRDPRMRVISCAYVSLVNTENVSISDAEWFTVEEAAELPLAFDHNKIVQEAVMRLRGKISYTDIVFYMMPEKFTVSSLQEVYEIILGKKLIPAAFRRTIADKLEETDEFEKSAGHRPSRLYRKKLNSKDA